MDELHDETANPFAELSKVEPDADTARQAIFRVRAALLRRAEAQPRRHPWILRIAASSAACLAAALAFWLVFGTFRTATFAAMQSRVAQTKSVEFTMWDEDDPDDKSTVRILESGLMREDFGEGNYRMTDFLRRRVLDVDTESNEAHLVRGMAPRMRQNLYEKIRSIPTNAVDSLPATTINGKAAHVYRARLKLDGLNEEEFVVWVDDQTLLPVRMESKPIDADDEPDRTIIADIRFNEVSTATSFSTEPPAGMTLIAVGLERLQDPPSEAALLDPELKSGFGIGRLKFGMTKKNVIKALGKPDQVNPDSGDYDYFSRGYSIGFNERDRVDEIDCYTKEAHDMEVRDFKGHTVEGIRMGASRVAIEKIYGVPKTVNKDANSFVLSYPSRGWAFTLMNDRLIRIVMTKYALN